MSLPFRPAECRNFLREHRTAVCCPFVRFVDDQHLPAASKPPGCALVKVYWMSVVMFYLAALCRPKVVAIPMASVTACFSHDLNKRLLLTAAVVLLLLVLVPEEIVAV